MTPTLELALTPRKTPWYGWNKDHPDMRDAVLGLAPITSALPPEVDLSTSTDMPAVYNQLALGACTANGIKAVVDFDNHEQTGAFYDPSRLFIYFLERYIEGTTGTDSGAQIRDGIKVVAKVGNVPESDWPYDISTFTTPPKDMKELLVAADKDRALSYARVPQTEANFQSVLAGTNGKNGRPIVFGFTVYESFEQDVGPNGVVPMPSQGEQVMGGHCCCFVGYRKINGEMYLKGRNSWDVPWGDEGYFYMPMRYALTPTLASDFWVVKSTSDKS